MGLLESHRAHASAMWRRDCKSWGRPLLGRSHTSARNFVLFVSTPVSKSNSYGKRLRLETEAKNGFVLELRSKRVDHS